LDILAKRFSETATQAAALA